MVMARLFVVLILPPALKYLYKLYEDELEKPLICLKIFSQIELIQPLLLQPPLPVQETPQVAQSQVRGSGGPSRLFHCLYFIIKDDD